jgi:hypothetical protein
MVPSEIDSIIRVASTAVLQDEDTPENERMCCRHLLKLAIPLLEQARLNADLHAISSATSRATAEQVRNAVIYDAMAGRRSKGDWDAVCTAVIDRWGPASFGDYPSGVARTGD